MLWREEGGKPEEVRQNICVHVKETGGKVKKNTHPRIL